MNLADIFKAASPSVVGFISKFTQTLTAAKPHFPPIFGTGFFIDPCGVVVTNRHVVEAFDLVPRHPKTGESALAALMFYPGQDYKSWQMLLADVRRWAVLDSFTSSDKWFGETVPDIGLAQLGVCDVPALRLAGDDFYLKVGMDIATIGYPMGTLPLTALGKLNQVTPFLRHGIVSSVFPFPTAMPHGFTIDVMQQGGSSGSPILRADELTVVGMMSSGVLEWNTARSQQISLSYAQNTNISIAEPAHIIQLAWDEFRSHSPIDTRSVPTLADLRAKYPLGSVTDDLTWESWVTG